MNSIIDSLNDLYAVKLLNWQLEEKEKLIKKVADDYKYKIPQKLYVAMIN